MQWLASFILGIVTGLIAGLSVSPVIASILSTILALATAAIGLAGPVLDRFKNDDSSVKRPIDYFSLLLFSLGLLIALPSSIYTRTHNLLSPSLSELYNISNDVLQNEDLARRVAVFQLTGLDTEKKGNTGKTNVSPVNSVVFSNVSEGACTDTNISNSPNAMEAFNTWKLAPPPWPDLAKLLEDKDLTAYMKVWSAICE
ncbi:hypothetical protein [Curvivirga sp.]|uniref:hypothetical protein n=1 Tax=Curvivirga sp. TaxID=2856848 RepID=UPI003B5BB47D